MQTSSKGSVSKAQFYKNLSKTIKSKSKAYMTLTKYKGLIKQVHAAKKNSKEGKLGKSGKLLKKFDIVKDSNRERLIVPNTENNKVIYYITKNELFDALQDAHLNTSHGGRKYMVHYLQNKYKNVTYESIRTYLQLCNACHFKKSQKNVPVTKVKPTVTETDSVGRVAFISMEDEPDGDYNFIFVYRDKFTRFVQLKPLKNRRAKEIASVMLDIFSSFGAPCSIHSSGEDYIDDALNELSQSWNGPIVSHEKVDVEPAEDIRNLMETWLYRSHTTKWSEGLRFIQYMKNIMFDEEINKSPFEAMFGRKGKLDVSSLNLPQEMINDIRPEEEHADDIGINEMLEVVLEDPE